jgi:hypothetical protein
MTPRDYSRPRTRKSQRRQPVAGWVWFVSGFLVGTAATLIVTFQDFFSAEEMASAMRSASTDKELAERGGDEKAGGKQRPRFEFYTMLPEMEVAVPAHEVPGHDARKSAEGSVSGYVLQAGSFRKLAEADRVKAELALLGMQATIQTVAINGKNKWHRVRVGPFTNVQALNEARATLKSNGLEVMVLKIR